MDGWMDLFKCGFNMLFIILEIQEQQEEARKQQQTVDGKSLSNVL